MPLPHPQEFLERLFEKLGAETLITPLYLDHLCYRVATAEEYRALRQALVTTHTLLVESRINGRLIAVFRLTTPFEFRGRHIDILELPAPKVGSPYATGYEHIELVTDRPLEEFARALTAHGFSDGQIDPKGMTKSVNRDLRLNLGPGLNVKFHARALADVIAEEVREVRANQLP